MHIDQAGRYLLTCSDLYTGIDTCTIGNYEYQVNLERKHCILFLCSKHHYQASNQYNAFTTLLRAALHRRPDKPPDDLDDILNPLELKQTNPLNLSS